MSGPALPIFLGLLSAILGGAGLLKGGIYVDRHEMDMLHLVDIVSRMSQGAMPHLDFMTPTGAAAFAPAAALAAAGLDMGDALIWSQVVFAVILFPALWRAVGSRVPGWPGLVLGAGVLVLVLALGGMAHNSLSLHYNRWAWAAAFVLVALAALDPDRPRPVLDGVMIGALLSILALVKMTYFVAMVPVVALACGLRRAWGEAVWAVLTGLGVAVAVTLWAGPAYWPAYLSDLLTVAGSELRWSVQPRPMVDLVAGFPDAIGSLAMLAGIVLLRLSGRGRAAWVLLALWPGVVLIAAQNFGHAPYWLLLAGVLILAQRPAAPEVSAARWGLTAAGILAIALAAPGFIGMGASPFRHLAADAVRYTPLVPGAPALADIRTLRDRAEREVVSRQADRFTPDGNGGELFGSPLPLCRTAIGYPALFGRIASDLADRIPAGSRVFVADTLSAYWLYGPFAPVSEGAPWYFGALSGLENADYLLVPLCPLRPRTRSAILTGIDKAGLSMTELSRTEDYVLYAPAGG